MLLERRRSPRSLTTLIHFSNFASCSELRQRLRATAEPNPARRDETGENGGNATREDSVTLAKDAVVLGDRVEDEAEGASTGGGRELLVTRGKAVDVRACTGAYVSWWRAP